MLNFHVFAVILSLNTWIVSVGWAKEEAPKPKYGPEAVPLSISHEFFKGHDAPGFWAMIPYYLPQQNGGSCSVATVAMLVNAARAGQKLKASDPLATEKDLLEKVNQGAWKKSLWLNWRGVTLDEIQPLVEASLKAYGVSPLKVEVVHVNEISDLSRKNLHEALVSTGKSARSFILVNFLQSVYTADADVGHFAPVGAYDAEKKRVLIMDPDRDYYEPYWVSEETLLRGMATQDKQYKKNRGYVWITLPEHQ